MLKNYLKIALRNLTKNRFYSVIKIAGLAVGLAAGILIALFVYEDFSYDGFNTKKDRIVRVLTIDQAEGVKSKLVGVSYPGLAPAITRDLPEVVNSVRISEQGRVPLKVGDNLISSEGTFRTESSFFEIFDYKVLTGPSEGILDEPQTVVLTETLAKKLFAGENPVGKTIQSGTQNFKVKAVMADPPTNSHLRFDMLRSMVPAQGDTNYARFLTSFNGISVYSYLLLDRARDLNTIIPKLKQVADKNQGYAFFVPTLQYLKDVHLNSGEILFEHNTNKTDAANLYVLGTIALLVVLLAAVNFMNLVTAHATGRAKEVGLRKVAGAVRTQLIWQHLLESIVVTAISAVLAVGLAVVLLPVLNNIYQRNANLVKLLTPEAILGITGFVLIIGLVAGSYPAFVLSKFRPVVVLKGAFKNTNSGIPLRQSLVVIQFTISIALMVGTGVVFRQMRYIQNKDLGFSREQIISVPFKGQLAIQRARTFQAELKQNPNVIGTGTTSNRMGQQLGRTTFVPEGKPSTTNYIASVMAVDESFVPTMGMHILKGRNFSLDFPADSASSMVINEEMAKMLGWKEPIGKIVRLPSGPNPTDATPYTVIGLVKDFHFATIRHKVEPLFMLYNKNNNQLAVKINIANAPETLAFIEKTWKQINPETPYEYSFLDADFGKLYRSEQAFATMFSHFTVLALFIAVLGLFGLAAFTAEQRRKEIGIRRVLGAETGSLLYLLSREFIKLVVIAFVIASPLAWYLMNRWLDGFAYRTDQSALLFAVAGVAAVLVTLITVNLQVFKAVNTNPVTSLRSE
ncbi:FtsX-like permease family protein [Larkinella terrae]|uniref:FtsX-like permease family protein n=1 Tax=Larkinella terrae TaxID=2025311 RepID=A0A7K0ER43_9BACT|nr:FtsX-like permease family protein [Larkinella terrae]MRS64274.1 FtsX-like permease family protein [Larkinella terrae]